jgi:hypothetical protein
MYQTILYNEAQARTTLRSLWEWVRPRVEDGKRLRLSIEEERRTLPQNNLIHPTVRDLAREAGRSTDEDALRKLRYMLLEQWRFETKRAPLFERSLDGMRWVDVSEGTSDLDKPDCTEFIEWLHAWKATNGG